MTTAPKSMWDKAQEMADAYAKGTFIRLKDDGDKCIVMFRGDPFPSEMCYDKDGKKYHPPTEENKKKYGKPSLKFSFEVVDFEGDLKEGYTLTSRIFEMNVKTFKLLAECRNKYSLRRFFEVKRNGAKGDSQTTYAILPEDVPNEQLLAEVDAVEPLNVQAEVERNNERGDDEDEGASKEFKKDDKKKDSGKKDSKSTAKSETKTEAKPEPKTEPKQEAKTEAPKTEAKIEAPAASAELIDTKIAQQIGATIKELPDVNTAITKFLKRFDVKKVKDVPASRQQEAIEFVEQLVAEQTPKTETAEADPFA